jgi:RNA polymerase sigma-70 factor, ECF subfamily
LTRRSIDPTIESPMDFETLHTEFRPRIQRYLARLVGESEAEDLTQEVFVRVHRALPTFRGEAQLSTWIYRIATNAALDRLRSPSFKRSDPYGLLTTGDGEDAGAAAGEAVWPEQEAPPLEQQIHRQERLACFCDFVKNLPASYQAVMVLSELEDLTIQEISGVLGLEPGVVKIRLHRGRAKLLEQLKAHCSPEDWL